MPSVPSAALSATREATKCLHCAAHKRRSSTPSMAVSPHSPSVSTHHVVMAWGHQTMPGSASACPRVGTVKAASATCFCTGSPRRTQAWGSVPTSNVSKVCDSATGWGHQTMPGFATACPCVGTVKAASATCFCTGSPQRAQAWGSVPTSNVSKVCDSATGWGHQTMPGFATACPCVGTVKAANATCFCTGDRFDTPKHGAQPPFYSQKQPKSLPTFSTFTGSNPHMHHRCRHHRWWCRPSEVSTGGPIICPPNAHTEGNQCARV